MSANSIDLSGASSPIPVIVHLSGGRRGTTERLAGSHLRVGSSSEDEIQLAASDLPSGVTLAATLAQRESSFELISAPGVATWVNGERIESALLASGDVIELGQGGAVLRFRLRPPGGRAYKTMGEAFSDCLDCARFGSKGPLERAQVLLFGTARELTTQISPVVRLALLALITVSIAGVGGLWYRSVRLERKLAAEQMHVRGLARLLEESERNRFTVGDFEEARREFESRIAESLTRIESLEQRSSARERVIAAATPAIVFLQGSYGFFDPSSKRSLRYAVDSSTSASIPGVSLEGPGPTVEVTYTGTGFVATSSGHILTNRHIAAPWEFDEMAQTILSETGFQSEMRRLLAYFPGQETPIAVEPAALSELGDVALLAPAGRTVDREALVLADSPPDVGDELIVLGYPAGMDALLARADPKYVEQVLGSGSVDFWNLARTLAEGGYIAPLATVGIAGQVTSTTIVYDAETTHGGSGGPVLDLDGRVVAVNAAVIPQFGGSNLGVPASVARALMSEAIPEDSNEPLESTSPE